MELPYSHAGNHYPCKTCGEVFGYLKALYMHMTRKHRDLSVKKRYACDQCDYSSDDKSNFRRHVLIHIGSVKPYQCVQCKKSFRVKSKLTRHTNSVHDTQKFLCSRNCGKEFKSIPIMVNHVKTIHDKIKKYVCPVCDERFAQSHHFKRHKKLHE